ncbi:MAG: efflux RND transporter permease subunit, partial [Bacteroidota bacterium]
MRGFIRYFIQYPIAANLLMVGILILGIVSLFGMKSTFFPEQESRIISIQLIYPGASPEEIEEGVINKIEENLKGLTGIERYESVSRENSGTVTVTVFREYDADLLLSDVKNAVDRISSFPAGLEPPVVYKLEQLGRAITFSLS